MKKKVPAWKTLIKVEDILSNISADGSVKIAKTLDVLGQNMGADRIYFDLLSGDKTELQTMHQWFGAGLKPQPTLKLKLDSMTGEQEEVHLDKTSQRLIQTSALIKNSELLGFLSVEVYYPAPDWSPDEIRLVDQVATLVSRVLPLDSSAENRPEAPTQDRLAPKSDTPHMLIVEDFDANRLLLEKIIHRYGATFRSAATGRAAMKACDEEHFDVILMDLNMPDLDGFDATRSIVTSEGANKDTPIIAITADTSGETEQRCKKLGMKYFMTKPINHKKLSQILDELTGPDIQVSVQ